MLSVEPRGIRPGEWTELLDRLQVMTDRVLPITAITHHLDPELPEKSWMGFELAGVPVTWELESKGFFPGDILERYAQLLQKSEGGRQLFIAESGLYNTALLVTLEPEKRDSFCALTGFELDRP